MANSHGKCSDSDKIYFEICLYHQYDIIKTGYESVAWALEVVEAVDLHGSQIHIMHFIAAHIHYFFASKIAILLLKYPALYLLQV